MATTPPHPRPEPPETPTDRAPASETPRGRRGGRPCPPAGAARPSSVARTRGRPCFPAWLQAPRRAIRHLLTTLIPAALLAGCATGNADDAGPVATEAAEATNVISGLEATNVVEQFFKPTPTPLPYPTRIPAVHNIRITTDVGAQNVPTNQRTTYNRDGPLYVAAEIADLHPGQTVIGSFRSGDGTELFAGSVDIENDRELVWIPIQWDGASNAPAGSYQAVIIVEGPGTNGDGEPDTVRTEIGSITFQIQ